MGYPDAVYNLAIDLTRENAFQDEVYSGARTASVQNAREIILNSVKPLKSENVSILDAYNRILYDDIISDIKLPPVDDSAMDGYAVIAEDTRQAIRSAPVYLKIIGEKQAGCFNETAEVVRGTAVRIMTGAPIPKGADSVIRFEDTEENDGYAIIYKSTAKFANYRRAGETISRGDKVLFRGDKLNSADLGVLASLDRDMVRVFRQPTVSIISTGDELAGPGEKLEPGRIRDINGYTLFSEVKKCNARPNYLGIARDTLKDVKEIFLKALKSDVVISTGGVSMGKFDFVKKTLRDLNVEIMFERVNVRPGTPFTFGRKGNKLFFGLPGRPVPTYNSFIQFVRPALLKMMGANKINKPVVSAVLLEDINKKPGKAYLLRGFFSIKDNRFYVSTAGSQKTSALRSISDANCLIFLTEDGTRVKAGERVPIQLINHDEI